MWFDAWGYGMGCWCIVGGIRLVVGLDFLRSEVAVSGCICMILRHTENGAVQLISIGH